MMVRTESPALLAPSRSRDDVLGVRRTMYGDDDDSGAEDARPLSFVGTKAGDERLDIHKTAPKPSDENLGRNQLPQLVRSHSDQTSLTTHLSPDSAATNRPTGLKKAPTFPPRATTERNGSADRPLSPLLPLSPTPSLKEMQETAFSSNMDDPKDIAQEFSNLQALRRMSMDVGNTTDPDLLQFSGVSLVEMPSIAPTGDDDEADPSRLLWVPARVHPELEPTAFKNFLEKRVQTMKRRSGESLLSADPLQRSGSGGGLRRQKSMLSRQVNTNSENGDNFVDGADMLARKRSQNEQHVAELSLSELVSDPTRAVQKLAQETRQDSVDGGDSPILPMAPGMGLRRSTKTTYRKGGSQRYGDRAPFAKRLAARQSEKESAEEPAPPIPPLDPSIGKPLTRVQTEPIGVRTEPVAENYSRPNRTVRRQQNFTRESPTTTTPAPAATPTPVQDESPAPVTPSSPPKANALPVRSLSTSAVHSSPASVPQIAGTPPSDESARTVQAPPQRSSSQKATAPTSSEQPPPIDPPARSSKRPPPARTAPEPAAPVAQATSVKEQTTAAKNALSEISQPHALPGSASATTSSLTFIPTFDSIERKIENSRKSKDKDDSDSILSNKSTSSWKWFKSDDKEKKKREKEKEREREEQARKAKAKGGDKMHDHARMDVLQSSIDNNVPKGRESLRLDRDSIEVPPPQEERRKDSNRKSGDGKKEREGFFGGLFGGSKKKGGDKEGGHKKKDRDRPRTPDPMTPARPLRPDIDYPWTRFPIIEERAIYRMAHIKLANPRRPLLSQVLLSNFMYSYLAKVQAMHPQLQIPISPQQKRQEEERRRREAEEAAQQQQQQLAAQQAAQDAAGFDFEYHRSGNQYGDAPIHQDGTAHYVDENGQIYEYDPNDPQQVNVVGDYSDQGGQGHVRQNSGGQQQNTYYHAQGNRTNNANDDENSDMW
ncbi:hypothetical protein VTJ49DRAFT_6204 [Mycothermus thermophilus]|uniref:Protein Zds1 C-terminal domain-containing protein n=1 Tax=Humicola insolens TaxID=85995 RepID=A0ABR3V263_HUMIN